MVGRAFSWTTWCSLDAATLPSAVGEVPVSSRSVLKTSFSLSTYCLLFNNIVCLWDLMMSKSSLSSIGAPG